MSVQDSLAASGAPEPARRFVLRTFSAVEGSDLCGVAQFFLGREDLLPDLFRRVVDALDAETGGGLEDFRYYLDRHIGLDEAEHGPAGSLSCCAAPTRAAGGWRSGRPSLSLESRKEL